MPLGVIDRQVGEIPFLYVVIPGILALPGRAVRNRNIGGQSGSLCPGPKMTGKGVKPPVPECLQFTVFDLNA